MRYRYLFPVLALTAGSTLAQTPTPPMKPMATMEASQTPCPATQPALPAGWNAAAPVNAAVVTGELAMAMVEPARGNLATLAPSDQVTYAVAPGHPGEPGTMGGMLAFAVAQAGTYRISLGAGAWIDVVRDGHAVASIAHGHGPACGPIRKTVDFTLPPGRYIVEVSGNRTPTLALMIAPVMP